MFYVDWNFLFYYCLHSSLSLHPVFYPRMLFSNYIDEYRRQSPFFYPYQPNLTPAAQIWRTASFAQSFFQPMPPSIKKKVISLWPNKNEGEPDAEVIIFGQKWLSRKVKQRKIKSDKKGVFEKLVLGRHFWAKKGRRWEKLFFGGSRMRWGRKR